MRQTIRELSARIVRARKDTQTNAARAPDPFGIDSVPITIEEFEKSDTLKPESEAGLIMSAIILTETGDYDQAIGLLTEAIDDHPEGNPDARFHRARAAFYRADEGDLISAHTDLNAAITMNPTDPKYHQGMSTLMRLIGKNTKALEHGSIALYIRLTNEDESDSDALADCQNLIGSCKLDLGDPKGAISHLEEAILYSPYMAEAHANIARARLVTDDMDGAAESAETAVRIAPSVDRLILRADIHTRNKNFAAAETDLKACVKMDPEAIEPYALLSQVLSSQGKKSQVKRVIRTMNRRAARKDMARLHEAFMLRKEGELDSALEILGELSVDSRLQSRDFAL